LTNSQEHGILYTERTKEDTAMESKLVKVVQTVMIVVMVGLACAGFVLGSYAIHHDDVPAAEGNCYALTCEVVEVDRDSDIVTCEDSNGNLWEFYGCEDWQVGDCASLLMWDNGTENITDDEIISARYNSWDLGKN
jgi:hypothetical protein